MIEFLMSIFLVTLLCASVYQWWRLLRSGKNVTPHWLAKNDRWIAPLGLVDVFVMVLIQLFSQTAAITVVLIITAKNTIDFADPQQMTWLNFVMGTVQLVAGAVILGYLCVRYNGTRAAGWNRLTFGGDLKLGGLGFLLFVPPTLVLQATLTQFWEYEHPTMDLISPESSLLTILSAWWMATIVAPFNEEVVFRVVLLGWLIRCFVGSNDFLAVMIGGHFSPNASLGLASSGIHNERPATPTPEIISADSNGIDGEMISGCRAGAPVVSVAMLFALVHLGQGPAPIPIFFLAIGLCLMYLRTGSLVACVVTHFLLNVFSMTVVTIEQLFIAPS